MNSLIQLISPFARVSAGIFSVLLTFATPALAAEKLSAVFGPIELSVPVKDLEIYARTGEITSEFRPYAKAASPQQLSDLRDLLRQRVELSPGVISRLAYTPTGEVILQRLGTVFRTGSGQNGFVALRAGFVQAAASEDGLTLVSLLREFPVPEIRVDLDVALEIAQEAGNLFFFQRQQLVEALQDVARQEAAGVETDFSQLPDLRQQGRVSWHVQFLDLVDGSRDRPIPTDLYLPKRTDPAPVVIISHGIGGARHDFGYLARHLASHGFAVLVPEHVGSNIDLIRNVFQGLTVPVPREAIDRPLDVTYILDHLEQHMASDLALKGRLNLQQVGAIGQSFGGYTILALAGAFLNPETLNAECTRPEPNNTSLNLSLLLQCRVHSLVPTDTFQADLQDDRIKAVLAINPFTSHIFGQTGVANIQIPVMIMSSGNDVVVPPGPEQLYPFTWLTTPDRYLVMMQGGTHFSTIAVPEPGQGAFMLPPALLGPDPQIAHAYTRALSLGFMQHYLEQAPQQPSVQQVSSQTLDSSVGERITSPYLNAGYAEFLSQSAMPLSLLQSLTRSRLDVAIEPSED